MIMNWDIYKLSYVKWIDTIIYEDLFTRVIGEYKIYINNCIVDYIYRMYKFPNLRITPRYMIYNNKIGTIDLETFTKNSENKNDIDMDIDLNNVDVKGLGIQENYADG